MSFHKYPCDSHQIKRYGVFIIEFTALLMLFLTEENFRFVYILVKTKILKILLKCNTPTVKGTNLTWSA